MATVTHLATYESASGSNQYTDPGRSIGANGGSDVLYAFAWCRTTNEVTPGSTTLTVDGVAADVVESVANAFAGSQNAMVLFAINRNSLPDPSQTDIDVVLTWSASVLRTIIDYWTSPDAAKTAYDTAEALSEGTADLDLDTPEGGIVIACVVASHGGAPATPACTWTGLTEALDDDGPGNTTKTSAAASAVASESPRNIACAIDAGISFGNAPGIAASFSVAPVLGPHPVDILTRLSLDGYGVRRCGSFANKAAPVPVEGIRAPFVVQRERRIPTLWKGRRD